MKLKSLLALVILMTVAMFSQGQERMTKTEELIKQLDGKLSAALIAGDSATVDAMLADNYTEINAQGLVRTKSDVMAIVLARASAPRSQSAGPEIALQTKLHMTGETAIMIGLKTTKYPHMNYQTLPTPAQTQAPTAIDQERFMKVYVRVNGNWRLAAFQTTVIARG